MPTSVILDFLVGADDEGPPKVNESLTFSPRYCSQYPDFTHLFVFKRSTRIHAFKHIHTLNTSYTISTLLSWNGKEAQQDPSKVYRLLNLRCVQEHHLTTPTCNMIKSHIKVEKMISKKILEGNITSRANGKENKKDVVARRLLPRASRVTGQAFDDLTFLSG